MSSLSFNFGFGILLKLLVEADNVSIDVKVFVAAVEVVDAVVSLLFHARLAMCNFSLVRDAPALVCESTFSLFVGASSSSVEFFADAFSFVEILLLVENFTSDAFRVVESSALVVEYVSDVFSILEASGSVTVDFGVVVCDAFLLEQSCVSTTKII